MLRWPYSACRSRQTDQKEERCTTAPRQRVRRLRSKICATWSSPSKNSRFHALHYYLRQRERDVLTRIVRAADGHDDVLLAVERVRHRRAALWRRHPHRAHLLAGLLVIRAKHRAATLVGIGDEAWIAQHDERFGHQLSHWSLLAGLRNVQALDRGMVLG